MLENSPICPNCHKADKVEKVSAIVADGFSTTPQADAEPVEWAGQTYYIQYKEREPTGAQAGKGSNISYGSHNWNTTSREYRSVNWNTTPRERITISPLADRLLPHIEKPDAPPNFLVKWAAMEFYFGP